MMDIIPVEIEHQILLHLSLNELFHFRSVSNHWKYVIIDVIKKYYCSQISVKHLSNILKNEYWQNIINDLFEDFSIHQKTKLCELYAAYGNMEGIQKCLDYGAIMTYKAVYYANSHSHVEIFQKYYDQIYYIEVNDPIDHTRRKSITHQLMKYMQPPIYEFSNNKTGKIKIKNQYELILKTINNAQPFDCEWLYHNGALNISLVNYIAKHNVDLFRNINNSAHLNDLLEASSVIQNLNLIRVLGEIGIAVTSEHIKMCLYTSNLHSIKWLYDNQYYTKIDLHWKLYCDESLWKNLIRKHHHKPFNTDLIIWLYNDFPYFRHKIMNIVIKNGDLKFLEYVRSNDECSLLNHWGKLMSVAIECDKSKVIKWLIGEWTDNIPLFTVDIGLYKMTRYKKSYLNGDTITYQRDNSKSYLLFKEFVDQIDPNMFDQIVIECRKNK